VNFAIILTANSQGIIIIPMGEIQTLGQCKEIKPIYRDFSLNKHFFEKDLVVDTQH
jgi:hypothetical protein